ncbi:MAG: 2-oxoacid:acceptor oxidoreductase subunit alpha [Candidatus Marinimicrobia bacterium]|nr:2-oxoacid:acceptor oxidoreductase subunit alpha [Candidatus Neomarinimicrobiota bacterium]
MAKKTKSRSLSRQRRGGWTWRKSALPPGKYLLSGNEACAEGALTAGCKFFAGYPITPASEIGAHLAKRMPETNGVFKQMEDEISAIGAILGASWVGEKSMTATSGPGFSLMMENLGFADMTETPCIIVDVQRGGPSTGMPTKPSNSDIMMARWGCHGGIPHIVLTPSSVQECYDFTIKAFNLSEEYRTPVIILSDASLAHLSEPIEIKSKAKIFNRIYNKGHQHFGPTQKLEIPSMPMPSDGELLMTTGSAHNIWGERNTFDPDGYENLIWHLERKIKSIADLIFIEEFGVKNAERIVVACGFTGRIAKEAVVRARNRGIKVGLIRPKIIWPFPHWIIKLYEKQCQEFIIPEMNQGQLNHVIEQSTQTKVTSLPQPNGEFISTERILKYLTQGAWW